MKRLRCLGFFLGCFVLLGWPVGVSAAEPVFPALTGRVVDEAGIIPDAKTRSDLDARLARLETDTGAQLVVVTVAGLQDYEIEDYGYRLGRAWGIGDEATNRGALLIIAPVERKVRIEVGYGLEPYLTDAFSAQVIQTVILPEFRQGHYRIGIDKGVRALDAQLRLDPEVAAERAKAARLEESAPVVPAIIFVVILFVILSVIARMSRGRGRRWRGGIGSVILWSAIDTLASSSRSSGGSGQGGGFGSGGGFSGGGGSFGGGGASGGW